MENRSRLAESAVGIDARRNLQAPFGASSSCAYRPGVTVPDVVTVPARLDVFHVDLPPPKFSVASLHKSKTEPFLNTVVRLRAVFCHPDFKR